MDYIKQLNEFWEMRFEITNNEAILYLALLQINNRLHWKKNFELTNEKLSLMAQMKTSAIVSNRNKLKQKGLIDFIQGGKHKPTIYQIIDLSQTKYPPKSDQLSNQLSDYLPNQFTNQLSNQLSDHLSTTTKDIYRNGNGNGNKEKVKKEKPNLFAVTDCSENLRQALLDFEEMRKQIKQPLTDRAKKLLLGKLEKFAKTEGEKIAILEQSTLNNWRDVWPLKQEKMVVGNQSAQDLYNETVAKMEEGGLL